MRTGLEATRRKLVWLASAAWLLLLVISALLVNQGLRRIWSDPPARSDKSFFPAGPLNWPWSDFPSTTEGELATVKEILGRPEPWMREDLRPWKDIPEDGPFGFPPQDRVYTLLEQSEALLENIAVSRRTTQPDLLAKWQPNPQDSDEARRELSRAIALKSPFIALYNRGLLQIWAGQPVPAIQDLRAAIGQLAPHLSDLGDPQRVWVYQAAIHSHYALGHALFAAKRRTEAIQEFRTATGLLTALLQLPGNRYTRVDSAYHKLSVRPTNLDSRALWNDLIAAYLDTPDYHACPPPKGVSSFPDCTQHEQAACGPRDAMFCKGEESKASPLDAAWTRLSQEVYEKGRWDEEHRLWALSGLMQLASVDRSLGNDSRLLYNSAILLVEQGELNAAADQMKRLQVSMGGQQVERLDMLLGVVLDRLSASAPSEPKSTETESAVRKAFYEFYDHKPDLIAFPPQDALFGRHAELIDRWLFIRLWRESLRQGDFQEFLQESDKLLALHRDGLFLDFFRQWRKSVLTELGQRALDRARQIPDADRAMEIRTFLVGSGVFPDEIVRSARQEVPREGLNLWWLVIVGAPLLTLWVGLYLRGLVRLYRRTFMSEYRVSRKGGTAYPR
jgi:tetratricopeptide (TPR) repeat protein